MPNSVTFNEAYPVIKKSTELYIRAQGLMKPVMQTLAKGPGQFSKGVAPVYLEKGKGARVWDVDGNEYLDYNMAIGPVSLGYCDESVDDAITAQLKNGISFSLIHPLELELAELVQKVIPNAEAVRISKTGADVCSAAIRVSRAFTGRKKVVCCGYHGWHDWYIGTTSRNAGIPEDVRELTSTFEYNDVSSLLQVLDEDVACVILEPMLFEFPKNDFLQKVQELCKENGSLLIFDEMWTGFRFAVGGAQEYFGLKPDLALYSKACANGMPIALLTGRSDVMSLFEKDVFFFTTFGGETLSIAAAIATINKLQEKNVSEYLKEIGDQLQQGINLLAEKFGLEKILNCMGHPSRTMLSIDGKQHPALLVKTYMQQELLKKGILWAGFHNICYSHTAEDIRYTLEAYKDIFSSLAEILENGTLEKQLIGEPLEAVFRKVTRTIPAKTSLIE